MASSKSLISLPPELIPPIAQSLECADLLRFRQVSTYTYNVTATYSNTLVAAILKEQFRLEQKLFTPGPTDSTHHHDRNLKLAAATMMNRHKHLAPGHLIPRLVHHTGLTEIYESTMPGVPQDMSRAARLGLRQGASQQIALTDSTLGAHFLDESRQTKRVDYLHDNPRKPEAVVHPYSDEWESPERVRLWVESIYRGKIQAAADNLIGHDPSFDRAYFDPAFLHVIIFNYRQYLDIYDQVHQQLLLEEAIGRSYSLTANSGPWLCSAPRTVRLMIRVFGDMVNFLVQGEGNETRYTFYTYANRIKKWWDRELRRSEVSDDDAKWRARWIAEV